MAGVTAAAERAEVEREVFVVADLAVVEVFRGAGMVAVMVAVEKMAGFVVELVVRVRTAPMAEALAAGA